MPSLLDDGAVLTEEDAWAILREAASRVTDEPEKDQELRARIRRLRAKEHPKQRAFINDPSKEKVAVCSRRSGKTRACAHLLLDRGADEPFGLSAYVMPTRRHAKRIMWRVLKEIDHQHKLGIHFDNAELIATLPNGHSICLFGTNHEEDIDKLRGSAWVTVVVDETQAFGAFIEELIFEVVTPALMDFDGTLCLVGTPGAIARGFFYDVSTGMGEAERWPTHHWTCHDNPFLLKGYKGTVEQWLEERVLKRKGWTKETPAYRREYLGEWVPSDDDLVYRFNAERNSYSDAAFDKSAPWIHGLGVDLGFDDPTAFAVIAFEPSVSGECYIRKVYKRSKMSIADVARELDQLRAEFNPAFIVVDQGGLGKQIATELKDRYLIPCTQAEKRSKYDAIEAMNADLLIGRVKAHAQDAAPWIDEAVRAQWDPDRRRHEDPKYPNDTLDAVLYAWRESRHYMHVPQPKVAYGSPEWWEAREQEAIAVLEQEIREEQWAEKWAWA